MQPIYYTNRNMFVNLWNSLDQKDSRDRLLRFRGDNCTSTSYVIANNLLAIRITQDTTFEQARPWLRALARKEVNDLLYALLDEEQMLAVDIAKYILKRYMLNYVDRGL